MNTNAPDYWSGRGDWVFTVGVQYAQEQHPIIPTAHPDSYALVRNATYAQARLLVMAIMDDKWAFQYAANEYTPKGLAPFLVITVAIDGD